VTASLARHADDVEGALAQASGVATSVAGASGEVGGLASDLRALTGRVDERFDGVGEDVSATLSETRQAASTLKRAAGELEGLVGELRQPLGDFSATGLYEFTQLIGETRQLIAALTRITKEFERDPAGFLLGSSQRGFEAE
jgi:phospholipid/cholesterol/gamma-HCH transport system substrate-binding protein